MNLLSEVIFEKEVNGKRLRMSVMAGSSYQECHDFCVDVMKKIMELAEQDNKRQQAAAEAAPQEQVVSQEA
jgi:hypothetical protein